MNNQQPWYHHLRRELCRLEATQVAPFQNLVRVCSYSYYFLVSSLGLICVDRDAVHREEALLDELDASREQQGNLESQLVSAQDELISLKSY